MKTLKIFLFMIFSTAGVFAPGPIVDSDEGLSPAPTTPSTLTRTDTVPYPVGLPLSLVVLIIGEDPPTYLAALTHLARSQSVPPEETVRGYFGQQSNQQS